MIRPARKEEAMVIARLIIQAMDDLAAKFIGESDPYLALPLFEKFVALPGNQYSYENILVYEEAGLVCGMISAYDGADLEVLRRPFLEFISSHYGFKGNPENETQKGEYYIDCLSVAPGNQGKGIGKKLIGALVAHAANLGYPVVGLLVSKNNPKAEKLYSSLGFKVVEEKVFIGADYFHMQCAAS